MPSYHVGCHEMRMAVVSILLPSFTILDDEDDIQLIESEIPRQIEFFLVFVPSHGSWI